MTIRARLFAAIALTVLGPLVTIGVALSAFGALGDRFEEVRRANAAQALALDLKFSVTDMNGWQTAYGYDDGRSRTTFVTSAQQTADLLERARRALTAPRERALLDELGAAYDDFMQLDERAWARALANTEFLEKPLSPRQLVARLSRHFAALATASNQPESRHAS